MAEEIISNAQASSVMRISLRYRHNVRQTAPAFVVSVCYVFSGECDADSESRYEKCGEHSYFAMVLFAVYMVMTNVLLLNLLIALFK